MGLQLLDSVAIPADQMMMVFGHPLVTLAASTEIELMDPVSPHHEAELAVEGHLVWPQAETGEAVANVLDAKGFFGFDQNRHHRPADGGEADSFFPKLIESGAHRFHGTILMQLSCICKKFNLINILYICQ